MCWNFYPACKGLITHEHLSNTHQNLPECCSNCMLFPVFDGFHSSDIFRLFVQDKQICLSNLLTILITCKICLTTRSRLARTDVTLVVVRDTSGEEVTWSPLRKHTYSNIMKILQQKKKKKKKWKCSDINFWYFSYFCSKHRLWVLVRTASMMFFSKIRKIMYTPVNPSFTIFKWGLRGSKLYRCVFMMS